MVGAPFADL